MAHKKSWLDKLNEKKAPQVKRIEKDFADIPAGSTMLIATPLLIEEYVKQIPAGKQADTGTIRKDLALQFNADYTCPVTTGIYLRIVAEANYEKMQAGEEAEAVAPFWRAIPANSALAKKLSCGKEFLLQQLKTERS